MSILLQGCATRVGPSGSSRTRVKMSKIMDINKMSTEQSNADTFSLSQSEDSLNGNAPSLSPASNSSSSLRSSSSLSLHQSEENQAAAAAAAATAAHRFVQEMRLSSKVWRISRGTGTLVMMQLNMTISYLAFSDGRKLDAFLVLLPFALLFVLCGVLLFINGKRRQRAEKELNTRFYFGLPLMAVFFLWCGCFANRFHRGMIACLFVSTVVNIAIVAAFALVRL